MAPYKANVCLFNTNIKIKRQCHLVGDGHVNDGVVHSAWLTKIQTETSGGCHGTTEQGINPCNTRVCVKTLSLESRESHLFLSLKLGLLRYRLKLSEGVMGLLDV